MVVAGRSGEAMMKLYTYNGFNQLIRYADGMNYAEYQYNANGLRTKKTLNHETTNFTWDGTNLAKEQTGDITNIYNYDITGIHSASMNGSLSTYIKDTHGNVIGVTDDTGVIVNNYEYDAFGVQISGDSAPSPFGYCGEYLDNESGLIYLRNRYYNSETGRFITEDPIKDGMNWYAYCSNNPVLLVDPSGLGDVPKLYLDSDGNSTIPIFYDWDRDGRMDTAEDRARFDKDNNGVADWHEDDMMYLGTKANPIYIDGGPEEYKAWVSCRNSNILEGFPIVDQADTNLCWAASASSSLTHITNNHIDFIQFAKNYYKDGNYNKGMGSWQELYDHIKDFGYLNGSGYELDPIIYNHFSKEDNDRNKVRQTLTFSIIMNKINNGIPLITQLRGEEHAVSMIGYAYDDDLNRKLVVFADSAGAAPIREYSNLKLNPTVTFQKIN